jgi:hypothetical protein
MNTSIERYLDMCKSAAQSVTPGQPVRAVGILGWSGRRARGARGFPPTVMMALTPTRLMSFEYRPRPNRIKILRKVADWPRSVVDVEVEPTGNGELLRFRLIDGTNVELQRPNPRDEHERMNASFYAALGICRSA